MTTDAPRLRIAIDATSVPVLPAGAGVYAIELVRALAARPAHRDGWALFARAGIAGEFAGRRDWRVESDAPASRLGRAIWEQTSLPGRLGRLSIDVLHSTHHSLPLRPLRAGRVVTIHDLTFFRLPGRYPAARRLYMQTMTRVSARVADAIIVPSRAVAADVTRILRADRRPLHVISEAASALYAPVAEAEARAVARRYGLERPYILSVGSREPGKNRLRLIEAFARLSHRCDVDLAIIGQPAWHYEAEDRSVARLGIGERVRMLGYVAPAAMPALYSAASLVAFPSLYEGFGLPVLEAMASGVPVLTSATGATAEVAGDAALLVDPRSVEEIRAGLERLLDDASVRADLSRRGRDRAAQFSWSRAAEETYAVYREVAAGRPA